MHTKKIYDENEEGFKDQNLRKYVLKIISV